MKRPLRVFLNRDPRPISKTLYNHSPTGLRHGSGPTIGCFLDFKRTVRIGIFSTRRQESQENG